MMVEDGINRCHSPLPIVSKSEVTEQQVAETIPRWKRHFIALQIIGGLCEHIIYRCAIVRHRRIRRDISIIPPRLARAYNPRQHFYELIDKLSGTSTLVAIAKMIKSTTLVPRLDNSFSLLVSKTLY